LIISKAEEKEKSKGNHLHYQNDSTVQNLSSQMFSFIFIQDFGFLHLEVFRKGTS